MRNAGCSMALEPGACAMRETPLGEPAEPALSPAGAALLLLKINWGIGMMAMPYPSSSKFAGQIYERFYVCHFELSIGQGSICY